MLNYSLDFIKRASRVFDHFVDKSSTSGANLTILIEPSNGNKREGDRTKNIVTRHVDKF